MQYGKADCLIFPSRIETWGLPISEFAVFDKPMLLADLPYAYETSAGCNQTAYFDVQKPSVLKGMMQRLIEGDNSFLKRNTNLTLNEPLAYSWQELFSKLLNDENTSGR